MVGTFARSSGPTRSWPAFRCCSCRPGRTWRRHVAISTRLTSSASRSTSRTCWQSWNVTRARTLSRGGEGHCHGSRGGRRRKGWSVSREIVIPTVAARIGKYELVEPLGVGGMAEVFKARCTGAGGFERLVVIKKILPAHCQDPDFLRMFIAEAKILGMLHHPNVIQAYDFGEEDGVLFLVLEYADGPSLMRTLGALRAARRPMPPAIAAHFAHELCRALDYVHGLRGSDDEPLGVIHRDVTPGNVVLTSSGGLKLLDFGVARYSASVARSEHGTLKGKAAYLAPEALAGRDIDHRVDIFSVGAVLHEMLTGDALFAAGSHLETIWRILEAPVPRPSSLRSGISRDLDAVVMKALERDPR